MIYLIGGTIIFFGGVMIVMMMRAKVDVKKDMEVKKFWQRMDYADKVINECFKIESE